MTTPRPKTTGKKVLVKCAECDKLARGGYPNFHNCVGLRDDVEKRHECPAFSFTKIKGDRS